MSRLLRGLSTSLWFALSAAGGPPLTTIQDVIYKADGARFNGTLSISWNGFEAPDQSAIGTQMVTVNVLDGNLRVKLVPTNAAVPAVYYSVVYNSDGHVQFNETWSVPASALSLRLRDVRITTPATAPVLPVLESDVTGLVADLDARPKRDASFTAGRVAMVNVAGSGVTTVTGNAGDCVHVDGSTGACGGGKTWNEMMTTTWDSLR